MFTGIVTHVGKIKSFDQGPDSAVLVTTNPFEKDSISMGESIATSGVCLTVTDFSHDFLRFDLAPETLRATSFRDRSVGQNVNFERSLRMGDRLSGHWVQGHVDHVGVIQAIHEPTQGFYDIRVKIPSSFLKYCIPKGSIAIEGVSLTIHSIENDELSFQIIPHTWKETQLHERKCGDLVNFEVDLMAKYLENFTFYDPQKRHQS